MLSANGDSGTRFAGPVAGRLDALPGLALGGDGVVSDTESSAVSGCAGLSLGLQLTVSAATPAIAR
ncbi:MAG TPA: hypothetical protein VHE78_18825 [Gemmatimonadaceae bacterium]|nr:hypothetical protein [Gemmatimonadaceae bacterium]